MTNSKTLSNDQESAISDAASKLKRLETVQDMLPPASYRAAQREVLRNMVKRVTSRALIA